MCNNNMSKKTLGRRRIEIKKIQKKTNLQVTFSKRRNGLFGKASELVLLCGAEVAILVQSPAGKIFAFGHPYVEALIDRFQVVGEALPPEMAATSSSSLHRQIVVWDDGRSNYKEAVRRLEMEKRRTKEKGWWDEPCEGLELHELEEYLEALENLRGNVSQKLEEMEKLMKLQGDLGSIPSDQELSASSSSTSSNLLAIKNHHQPLDYDLFEFISN